MHIDARNLENNSLIEGDICIVGAGAAGISMALEWINTPYKVILLEGGGFEYDEQVQELYAGKTTGQRYFPLKSIRLHYFGGTTGHWAGWCATFDAIDFKKREWIPQSGWPITLDDVNRFIREHKNMWRLEAMISPLLIGKKKIQHLSRFLLMKTKCGVRCGNSVRQHDSEPLIETQS